MTYTRINPETGVREFSTCKTIKTSAGLYISNPTAEQIAAEGWEEYIPPVIPPQPQDEPSEQEKVQAINKMLATDVVALDDEAALEVMALFPTWRSRIGTEAATGERFYDDEKLWKVLQPHTIQESWRPMDSPSLYVRVSIEEWPEWVQPLGSTDAYRLGAKVSHNDAHWISLVDGNVWEPSGSVTSLWTLIVI